MKNLHTLNFWPTLETSSCLHPVLTGPDAAYLGSRVAFRCIAPNSPLTVTYDLIKDGDVLIATDTNVEKKQPAPFSMRVSGASGGSYHCKATAGGSTGISNTINLSVVIPASNTRVTSDRFPPVAYEGSQFTLSCEVVKGTHLSYTWFFNREELTSTTPSFIHLSGNKLVMRKVTAEHAGYYSCMAWSRVQDTKRMSSSTEVQVTVKVYVSKPRISFSIYKDGDSYHGNVTCWSATGSPPVNFSVTLDEEEVRSVTAAESLVAWFPVPIVLGVDMGMARCRVNTEMQELMSEPMALLVVPVGGEVKVAVEYLYKADSTPAAARLSCQVGRGTFPYVSWLFNGTVIPPEINEDPRIQPVLSHYAIADHRQTLFLAKLGPKESGYYRCRARDSYIDSGSWVESSAVLVQGTEFLFTIVEIISIVFCCVLLLVLVVAACCVYKMFDEARAYAHMITPNSCSDAFPLSARASQSRGPQVEASSDVQYQTFTTPASPAKPSALQVIPPTHLTAFSACCHQVGNCRVCGPEPAGSRTVSFTRRSEGSTPSLLCPLPQP
ncbi:Fc receptor-like protein 5 isoform X2 [Antennarius striatus]|uniref:Fc receptor-like protein 5 isoform X2 n=1 Tax=Antennarius striatus TaxID=241820 RepID=UPI0035AEFAEE